MMRFAALPLALLLATPALAQAPPILAGPSAAGRAGAARSVSAGRQEIRGALRRPSSAAMEAARRYLCPNGGTPQGRGRCSAGSGVGMMGDDSEVRGWDRGITPPNRSQAPCPPGTVAGTARDQPGVTRCVAG
ncbi:MAG: hypothetical protein JWR10_415 [Rubritepida sp.]|nr:hypothetical protein [Rubritepida sp.]